MKIGTTKLIAENIAPDNATNLVVYNNDVKIGSIDISKIQLSNLGEKLYSFGLVSDMHVTGNNSTNGTKLNNALTFFENEGMSFCCHAGDITNIGFWMPIVEGESSYFYPDQFEEFRDICQSHNIPVYGCCGNHESYNGYNVSGTYTDTYGDDPALVINTLDKLQEYTGTPLYFTVSNKPNTSPLVAGGNVQNINIADNDIFIFVGQPSGSQVMSDEALQWLYDTLEENRNKRCFVFVHAYIEEDSGDPLDYRENSIFEYWGSTRKGVFLNLMRHYKNTILFHGHSHTKYSCQLMDKSANYTDKNGFRSFHIPSSGSPRYLNTSAGSTVNDNNASEGCIAEVYKNFIVLKGYDFISNEHILIAHYCINTSLVNIEAGTFTDNTGIITT